MALATIGVCEDVGRRAAFREGRVHRGRGEGRLVVDGRDVDGRVCTSRGAGAVVDRERRGARGGRGVVRRVGVADVLDQGRNCGLGRVRGVEADDEIGAVGAARHRADRQTADTHRAGRNRDGPVGQDRELILGSPVGAEVNGERAAIVVGRIQVGRDAGRRDRRGGIVFDVGERGTGAAAAAVEVDDRGLAEIDVRGVLVGLVPARAGKSVVVDRKRQRLDAAGRVDIADRRGAVGVQQRVDFRGSAGDRDRARTGTHHARHAAGAGRHGQRAAAHRQGYDLVVVAARRRR